MEIKTNKSAIRVYCLASLATLTAIFILIWLVDIVCSTFNPNYQPFLSFLEIANTLLQTILGAS